MAVDNTIPTSPDEAVPPVAPDTSTAPPPDIPAPMAPLTDPPVNDPTSG